MHFELNENENTAYQNLCDAAKAVVTQPFIALNTYVRKEDSLKPSYLKKLKRREQIKLKVKRKQTVKIEVNSMK